MKTRTTFVSTAIVLLTALAFACQISLASAAEEAKKHKKSKGSKISRSTSAKAQPGGDTEEKQGYPGQEIYTDNCTAGWRETEYEGEGGRIFRHEEGPKLRH